jgi:hypothetical protein
LSDEVSVEIVEYLPHAVPDRLGNFVSKDDSPKNPLLELGVHLGGGAAPIRQIALANDPLLSLDAVYNRACPVKFRYRHAAAPPASGVEFLQTRKGRLLWRMAESGEYSRAKEATAGRSMPLPGGFDLVVEDHLPHARLHVEFTSQTPASGQAPTEPAVLVETSAGGALQQTWLQRNSFAHGAQSVSTAAGEWLLTYGAARRPLGFSLQLIDMERRLNPGGVGDAGFSSKVRVIDPLRRVHEERLISMNQPLTYGGFTFYQSSFDESGHGKETSTLTVARDPGRAPKYAGGLMICVGIAITFCMRAHRRRFD